MPLVYYAKLGLRVSVPREWVVREFRALEFAVHPQEYTNMAPQLMPIFRYLRRTESAVPLSEAAREIMRARVAQGVPTTLAFRVSGQPALAYAWTNGVAVELSVFLKLEPCALIEIGVRGESIVSEVATIGDAASADLARWVAEFVQSEHGEN